MASRFQELAGPGGPLELGMGHVKFDGEAPHHQQPQRYLMFKGEDSLSYLHEAFHEFARESRFGDRPFLAIGDQEVTYREAVRRAKAVALSLSGQNIGVVPGDRVCVMARNSIDWVIAFMAASLCGAIPVPMNSWYVSSELAYALEDSGSKVAFVDEERLERLMPIRDELSKLEHVVKIGMRTSGTIDGEECETDIASDTKPDKAGGKSERKPSLKLHAIETLIWKRLPDIDKHDWSSFVRTTVDPNKATPSPPPSNQTLDSKPLDPKILSPESIAIIMYTSGTTSKPKGVSLTHRGVCNFLNTMLLIQLAAQPTGSTPAPAPASSQKVILMTVPLFHATGLHTVFLTSFLSGRKIVFMHKWDAGKALELIERHRITNFTGVPTMSMELMRHPDAKTRDISSLKNLTGGGAPTPPAAAKEIKKTFPKATAGVGYGLTEINALATSIFGDDYEKKPDSSGKPIPIISVQIWGGNAGEGFDPKQRKVLGPQSPGRVMLRGVTVMKDYWNKPEATKQAISPDGWFETGDIGRLDEDGYLYIMDRAKDMIIRGGENISCSEVESAIHRHPAVAEAAVFGVPHDVLGEEVGAAIHPKPGMEDQLDLESLRQTCKEFLADFKKPTKIFIWKEPLPRGATGKIPKKEIKEQVLKDQIPATKL